MARRSWSSGGWVGVWRWGWVGRGEVRNCLLLRVASGPAQLGTGRLGLLLQQSQTFGGAKQELGGEIEEGSAQQGEGRLLAAAAWSPHPPGRAGSRRGGTPRVTGRSAPGPAVPWVAP